MERRRLVKRALLSAAAFLAAGTLVVGMLVDRAASAPELKPRIEAAASEFLGRPMTIDALEWRRWPDATLVGRNVRLYEDSGKRRLLVDAPVVEAHLAVLSLFKLAAGITELRFRSPRVSLRRDKDGGWNAVRVVDEIAARPDEPRRKWGTLAFNWFVVEGGTVTVEDAAGHLGSLAPLDIQGSGKLRFGRRRLHFPFELAGRLEGSAATVEVTGDLGGRSRLRADMTKGDVSLARLLWPPAASWTGRWDGDLDFDERPSERWRVRARGEAITFSTAAPRLDSIEATVDYAPSSSSTFALVARSSGTEIEARGSLRGRALDLDVKSPRADLLTLLAFARAPSGVAPATPSGSPRKSPSPSAAPWRLTARISADVLRYGPAELHAVHAVVRHSTGPYSLDNLSFQSLGGSVAGSGSYLPAGGDGALKLAWTTSGISLQELFRLAGSSHEAAGVADSEGAIVTGLGDRFLPALNGTVKVDLKNGWFGGMSGLLKVLTRLNLTTLFAEAAGHHRARVPFDEAHGTMNIFRGKISTDQPLVLKNKTLELAFLGTYDLPSRTVDGKLVVNILTVTDEIVKLIPGVRDLLLGGEKSMIPIWVKVKGKADDPDIDVLEAKTIAAPFWNTIGRVIRLPKTLFKKLGL